ncbi:MAG TPA: hypothetical protein PLW65_30130, partial [Pseudomonadota bacterium]|nr:hypothetical protein [Pseudomonadota bacterium]
MRSQVAAVALAVLSMVACEATQRSGRPPAALGLGGGKLQSNILRGDYAGSAACAPCHADI